MAKNPTPFSELLVSAYLAGELDAETADRVRAYFEATPQQRAYLAYLRASIRDESLGAPPPLAASKARLFAQLDAVDRRSTTADREGAQQRPVAGRGAPYALSKIGDVTPGHIWYRTAAIAAVLGVVLTAGLVTRVGRRDDAPLVAKTTYRTQRGERAAVTLRDGTQVHLAPMSVLTVASGFGSAIREVTLQGEAVFTVSHVTGQPFIVRTSASTTRVLGTIFDVRAYAGDTESRVTVQQGRVAMNAVVLSAGDIGVSTQTGTAPVVQHSPSIARLLDWTQGVLSFQDTPLRDVAEQLSRWYDVDFVVRDSLVGQLPLSTTIRASETIDSTMSLIAITTGTVVERHGRTVTISRATHARYIPELPAPSELAMKSRMQHTS